MNTPMLGSGESRRLRPHKSPRRKPGDRQQGIPSLTPKACIRGLYARTHTSPRRESRSICLVCGCSSGCGPLVAKSSPHETRHDTPNCPAGRRAHAPVRGPHQSCRFSPPSPNPAAFELADDQYRRHRPHAGAAGNARARTPQRQRHALAEQHRRRRGGDAAPTISQTGHRDRTGRDRCGIRRMRPAAARLGTISRRRKRCRSLAGHDWQAVRCLWDHAAADSVNRHHGDGTRGDGPHDRPAQRRPIRLLPRHSVARSGSRPRLPLSGDGVRP
jgi:hypothetical protein